jgi:hypothetical protein
MDPEKVVMICFVCYIYFLYFFSKDAVSLYFLKRRQYISDLINLALVIEIRSLTDVTLSIQRVNLMMRKIYTAMLNQVRFSMYRFMVKNLAVRAFYVRAYFPLNRTINLTLVSLLKQASSVDNLFCALLSYRLSPRFLAEEVVSK